MAVKPLKKQMLALSALALLITGATLVIHDQWATTYIPRPGTTTLPVSFFWKVPSETQAKLPRTLPVYRFATANVSEEEARALAGQFMEVASFVREEQLKRYSAKADNGDFFDLEWQTGRWSYNGRGAFDSSNTNIPSDDVAEKMVTQYLTTHGWLPQDFRFRGITASTESHNGEPPRILSKCVSYGRYVNDLPVLGLSRITATLGDQGRIIGVSVSSRRMEPAGVMELKSPDTAFTELRLGRGLYSVDDPHINWADVVDVRLAYWEDPDQPLLQPMYIFTARTPVLDPKEFSAIVPAGKGVRYK